MSIITSITILSRALLIPYLFRYLSTVRPILIHVLECYLVQTGALHLDSSTDANLGVL
jgi:hypothetical protein